MRKQTKFEFLEEQINSGWLERWVAAFAFSLQAADREDLIQESCIKFLKAPGPDTPEKYCAYLHIVIKNKFNDDYRKRKRRPESLLEEPDTCASESREHQFHLADELRHAMSMVLTQLEQRVVTLHAEGYSHKEIAKVIGMTYDVVRQIFSHALQQLRDFFQGEDDLLTPLTS